MPSATERVAAAVGERGVTLDGDDRRGQPRQDGRLIAGSGANLEHAIGRLHGASVAVITATMYGCEIVWPLADRQRPVVVGLVSRGRSGTKRCRGTSRIASSTRASRTPRAAICAPPFAPRRREIHTFSL